LRPKLLMNRSTMLHNIRPGRDRTGHGALGVLTLAVCLVAVPAAAQGAGDYKAKRFDVTVTPVGSNLDVVETIVFEFQSGTFKRVWREISASRTDGIEILDARMDDVSLPRGDGEAQVAVTGRSRVRVQWNFAPTAASVHTFQLHYTAHGVVYREGDRDVLRWRALPSEHRYRIAASRIVFATTAAEVRPLEARRIDAISTVAVPPGVVIEASGIQNNGWVIVDLQYPAGTLTSSSLPAWQQRSAEAVALAPRWLMGGAALLLFGLIAVFAARQGYAAPGIAADETSSTSPPEPLPAALATVLVNKGRATGHMGVATLLDLAERGVLRVQELRGSLAGRHYELSQVPGSHQLERHEEAGIQIAFGGKGDDTSLAKARRRLARGSRRFVDAVNADLERRGLLDRTRQDVRKRVTVTAGALLIAAALGTVACATLIRRFEAWPFLLPLGLLLAGMVGIIVAASTTPLSDRGAIEAARWRGFKSYLKALASDRDSHVSVTFDTRWIVYGMAIGLAAHWARYLKSHPGLAPAWFSAATADDGAAFSAFVGANVAASGGHTGGAGGGAAGGGGSGAG